MGTFRRLKLEFKFAMYWLHARLDLNLIFFSLGIEIGS